MITSAPLLVLLGQLVSTLAGTTVRPTSTPTAVGVCMVDVPADLTELRGRRAWVQRCVPNARSLPPYPEGSYPSFADFRAPTDAAAPCVAIAAEAIVCSGEGLMPGQRVLTSDGWHDVAELQQRNLHEVASWDSTARYGTPLPMSEVQRTVRRPYYGAVVVLETDEGAILEVTAGQLVLLARGVVRRADALGVGDALYGFDGLQRVLRVRQEHRSTWTYQIVPARADFDHNVVFAEGLFIGAAHLTQAADLPPAGPAPRG